MDKSLEIIKKMALRSKNQPQLEYTMISLETYRCRVCPAIDDPDYNEVANIINEKISRLPIPISAKLN